jgi:hypothetical protein
MEAFARPTTFRGRAPSQDKNSKIGEASRRLAGTIRRAAHLKHYAAGESSMDDVKEFFAAIRGGDAARVKTMLEAQPLLASVKDQQGQSPVLAAVYSGRSEIRDTLIARGAQL